jgi:hypothetical protein
VPTRDELRMLVNQRVTLRLEPRAGAGETLTGRVLGTLDAADGLYVTVEPDGEPGRRVTLHHHDIVAATTESHNG